MKANTLLMLAFAVFTVTLNTACPRDIANKIVENDELVKEYNTKKNEANDILVQLERYGLDFTFVSIFPSSSIISNNDHDSLWSTKSNSDLSTIKAKLNRYLELAGRLAELQQHDNVKSQVKAGEEDKVRRNRVWAKSYLDSLVDYANRKSINI